MKRKALILLLAAMLAVPTALTGCGGNDNKEDSAASGTEKEEASDPEGTDASDETEVPGEDAQAGEDKDAETPSDASQEVDVSGDQEEAEAPAKKEKKEKIIMYTTVNLILRKKGNMDAEKIDILPVNTKVIVLKKGKEWHKVKAGGKKGFVFAEYLTKSKEKAKEAEALAAEAEAQAAAEAAAQAAAQNTYTPAQNNTAPAGGGQRTEVSREDYPDCDGSGHGYSEIHYSDGSTEIVEY